MDNKDFYTISEIANALGISRVAVFKKIKSGLIKTIRIGRMHAIPKNEFISLLGEALTPEQKKLIEEGVKKTVREYGETLRLLGRE